MNKLTAELLQQLKSAAQEEIMCREASDTSDAWQDLAIPENILLLVEIALPVLEQQESTTDTYRQIENDDWIEWGGGDCPVSENERVGIRFTDGANVITTSPKHLRWQHLGASGDIIAYRVIENDGRQ